MTNAQKFSKIVCVVLAAVMIFGTMFTVIGCTGDKTAYDNEKDALVFSTQAPDGVFNPFFSTSGVDSSIVGLTQISMLGNDAEGNVTYKHYKVPKGTKNYDENDLDNTVMVEDFEQVTTGDTDETKRTTYYFVLRNDVRCSDGSYLSMKDVLFNLYVYLDRSYTGSATMYSTDIVGLQEYRTQESNEKEQESFQSKFVDIAKARISNLTSACNEIIKQYPDDKENLQKVKEELAKYTSISGYEKVVEDFDLACKLFREELQNDFNNARDSWKELKFFDEKQKEYSGLITSDAEMFLYNEGEITWNKKDAALKYNMGKTNAKAWGEKEAIEYVFNTYMPAKTEEVVNYWQTATNLLTELVNQAMEEDAKQQGGKRRYPNISGIKFVNMPEQVVDGTTYKGEAVTVNGITYDPLTSADYDSNGVPTGSNREVLSITIKGVDPKAIWNFAFAVAPMSYYSDAEHINAFDYVKNFGVEYGSASFFKTVVNGKVSVPFGAGPYAASKSSGGLDNVSGGDFRSLGMIYYERNPYYVAGAPIIKKIRYKVVSTSTTLDALYAKEVHFAEPNAKPETIKELNQKESEGYGNTQVRTSGYGYIGINAAKVPDIEVRRAIMHAIDTEEIAKYYKTGATTIYRSMSTESWAYPGNTKGTSKPYAYYPYIGGTVPSSSELKNVGSDYRKFLTDEGISPSTNSKKTTLTEEQQIKFITNLVESAGYTKDASGVYKKGSNVLKYTFTIAGEEKDHPAYTPMNKAATLLNKCGFQITVTTDASALRKLSTGDLAVWAAAWGSTIDPDMYQVYHKDSKATSVLNWGYPAIINNVGDKYSYELSKVTELSELIDKARSVLTHEQRAPMYSKALDLVMELAIELPTYQRNDLFAYNTNVIDVSTFNENPSAFKGLISDLHKLSLNTTSLEK